MIAAGLCMMGGCFAQDETGLTMASYWPAHSVHVDHRTYIIKDFADDLLLPFWRSGMRAGGRLENVTWNTDDNGGSNILNWGRWEADSRDFLTLASTRNAIIGAVIYAVCGDNIKIIGFNSGEPKVDYMELSAADDVFYLDSPFGSSNAVAAGYPSVNNGPWQIRIKAGNNACDVVSFWWINDEFHKQYFMVQPMCSAQGETAFYTHGFDILTEL